MRLAPGSLSSLSMILGSILFLLALGLMVSSYLVAARIVRVSPLARFYALLAFLPAVAAFVVPAVMTLSASAPPSRSTLALLAMIAFASSGMITFAGIILSIRGFLRGNRRETACFLVASFVASTPLLVWLLTWLLWGAAVLGRQASAG